MLLLPNITSATPVQDRQTPVQGPYSKKEDGHGSSGRVSKGEFYVDENDHPKRQFQQKLLSRSITTSVLSYLQRPPRQTD